MFRKTIFWGHLVIGVSAGVLIFIMSVTGALLGFERQLVALVDGTPRATVPPGASPLPIATILQQRAMAPESVSSVLVKADPAEPVQVRLRGPQGGLRYVDPYSAAELPAPKRRLQPIMAALRPIHRVLGVNDGTLGTVTKRLTGIANLGFVLLAISGLVLWFPRRWTRNTVRAVTLPATGLSGKARDFNWHNAFGFWTAVPIVLVAGTAVFMSFRWPGRWLDRVAGSPAERAAARGMVAPPHAAADRPPMNDPAALDALLARARQVRPDWRAVTITLAGPADSVSQLLVASGNTYRPDLRTTLLLDPVTLQERVTLSYGSLSLSRRIRAWVRYGHTGEALGVFGQTVATIASLVGALLVWTGLALAWRRWWAWMRRQGVMRTGAPTPG